MKFPHYELTLWPVEALQPSEQVDTAQVDSLVAAISARAVWTTVLPVEAGSGYVMDGNHRLAVARRLGLRRLPCAPLHYGDPRLHVERWDSGERYALSELRALVDSAQLLPFKTTRHRFAVPLPPVHYALAALR